MMGFIILISFLALAALGYYYVCKFERYMKGVTRGTGYRGGEK